MAGLRSEDRILFLRRKFNTMRKMNWILIVMIVFSVSGRLVTNNLSARQKATTKPVQKQSQAKPEEEALETMMLLPISFSLETNHAGNSN